MGQDIYDFDINCANSYNPPLASLIWPLLGMKLAIVLIMIAHLVATIFLMRVLPDLVV